eukprot:4087640-Pyramimonas_sp.AAC.1
MADLFMAVFLTPVLPLFVLAGAPPWSSLCLPLFGVGYELYWRLFTCALAPAAKRSKCLSGASPGKSSVAS